MKMLMIPLLLSASGAACADAEAPNSGWVSLTDTRGNEYVLDPASKTRVHDYQRLWTI